MDIIRPGKTQDGKDIRDLNQVGNRIKWCREQLGLTQKSVCDATGIPKSSYVGRENGVRARFYEEHLVIAMHFNSLWQIKYKLRFPCYNRLPVKEIRVAWILFGIMDE